ncbi:hypothetical protein GCM10007877_00140 [Marinibactrum halimedae]|uniref:Alginate export domain-containing protein n=1 Tax=Marinibactrum halimedae TaxID=1444977 RepID=A0AA37WJK3_9GAMM|nr:hypothetical protein GCM10007877_00140 [Marinibactrum halimedae]
MISSVAFVFGGVDNSGAAEHSVGFSSRIRIADLETNGNSGEAASGLFRATLESSWSDSFESFVQLDHVESAYQNHHSNGVRFNGEPEIPDVSGTDLNQLFARFTYEDWSVTAGRQVIELDNQRFVGSVSVWQNQQTFDAVSINKKVFSNSHLQYFYVENANRIFGDEANERLSRRDENFEALNGMRPALGLGDHQHDSHLLRAEFNEWDYSKFVLYSYLIDNKDAPFTSNDSLGLRYEFKIKPDQFRYRFELENALQRRTGVEDKPTLSYFSVEGGVAYQSVELSARRERMGSKNNVAFVTPLATLHDFHGWADVLNVAPAQGLDDQSIKLKWRKTPFKFDVRYHRFASENGREKFGEEIDFDIIYKPAKKHVVLLRFADFKASKNNDAHEDVKRVILSYSYNF